VTAMVLADLMLIEQRIPRIIPQKKMSDEEIDII
jgi:hypothetical protein